MKQSSGLEWDLIKSEFSGTWSQSHPPQKAKLKKKVLFVYRGNQKKVVLKGGPPQLMAYKVVKKSTRFWKLLSGWDAIFMEKTQKNCIAFHYRFMSKIRLKDFTQVDGGVNLPCSIIFMNPSYSILMYCHTEGWIAE